MKSATRGVTRQEVERKLSGRQNELVGKFMMGTGDVISIRGQVMEYLYIPTGIKRELVRLRLEAVSYRNCWKRTGGHLF